MKRFCVFLVLLLTIAVCAAAEYPVYPVYAQTNKPAVNVRQSPQSNGAIVDKLRNGTNVTVIGEEISNGALWYAVKLDNGKSGYVKGELLTLGAQAGVANGIPQTGTAPANGYPTGNGQAGGTNQAGINQISGFQTGGNQTGNGQNGVNQMSGFQAGGNQTGNYQTGVNYTSGSQTVGNQAYGTKQVSNANQLDFVPNITFTTKHTGGSNYNNVGKEWTFYYELDGVKVDKAGGRTEFVAGREYTFYARIKEQDGKPEGGTATTRYTPTEDDVRNGFIVKQTITVKENGGKYSGNSVTWTVFWNIQPLK